MSCSWSLLNDNLARSDLLDRRRLAREYDLEVIFEAEFHSIFIAEQEVPEFAELLIRMRVLDANQQTQMDADQFETTSEFLHLDSTTWYTDDAP